MVDAHEREHLSELALGLLEDAERARVEAHVRACAECAAELSAYRATIEMLPEALPPAQAPAAAWKAVAARVRKRERRGRAGAGSWLGRLFGGRALLQPALLVVLVAAVIGLIGWNASLQARLSGNDGSALYRLFDRSGGRATVVTLVAKPGVSAIGGRLVMTQDRTEGGLVVGGMPALPAGQSYEIWFVRADQSRVPANTFTVDAHGQAVFLVDVPQPADGFDGVAITAEPSGGSPTPTGPDVLAGLIYQN